MIDIKSYLEQKIQEIISSWDEENIYAISFFVDANDSNEYDGRSNVTNFFVSYNTESDCDGAGDHDEERWNYAFWRQDETPIIDCDSEDDGIKILFDWYKEKGIENIGYEDFDSCYDEQMRYIGKGPVGCYELIAEITNVAKKLQESGFIKNKFKAPIPIIIHDLEYSWYTLEATRNANPNGEADVFFAAMKEVGMIE